jgi:anti-sigma B factor antagonist
MNLVTEIFGDVIVVHAPEEMNEDHLEGFVSYISNLDRNNVVLDMDQTELVDSRGLEALLYGHQHLRDDNGDLKIATTNSSNRKILEITRLDEHLEVFESVLDAVKSYS